MFDLQAELADYHKKMTKAIADLRAEFTGDAKPEEKAKMQAEIDRLKDQNERQKTMIEGRKGLEDAQRKNPELRNIESRDAAEFRFPDDARKELQAIMRGDTRAMSGAVDPDGGYLVPVEISQQIEAYVLKQSPIRRLARTIQINSPMTRLPVSIGGATGGWVGENEARTETNTPQVNEVTPPGGTVYANPIVSEELLEDAVANIETFIAESVIDTLAEKESQAFIAGTGVKQPLGFLAGTPVTTDDSSGRAFGALQYILGGNASGFCGYDTLVSTVMSLRSGFRQSPGCAWAMSTDVLSQIAKLKDGDGRPIFVPSLQQGMPGQLLGYPVVECEHMPSVVADNFPIAFGNWQRGYAIADRTQLSVLRDPYTVKGKISFYFRKRVHGAVLNSNAIKLIKVAP